MSRVRALISSFAVIQALSLTLWSFNSGHPVCTSGQQPARADLQLDTALRPNGDAAPPPYLTNQASGLLGIDRNAASRQYSAGNSKAAGRAGAGVGFTVRPSDEQIGNHLQQRTGRVYSTDKSRWDYYDGPPVPAWWEKSMARTEFPNCQLHGMGPVLPDSNNPFAEDWEVLRLNELGLQYVWTYFNATEYPDPGKFEVDGWTVKNREDGQAADASAAAGNEQHGNTASNDTAGAAQPANSPTASVNPPTDTVKDQAAATGYDDYNSGSSSQGTNGDAWDFTSHVYPLNVPEEVLLALVPKVYDVFLFNNELEMLEVRLNELDPVVDKFVIVDSPFDHQLRPKKSAIDAQFFKDPRFAPFKDKIVHVSLETLDGSDGWARERWSRTQSYIRAHHAVNMLPGDLVILGDLDELPRGSIINSLKRCKGWTSPRTLRTHHFYYSYEYRADFDWFYPSVIRHYPVGHLKYADANTIYENVDRNLGGSAIVNAGWHCSWCFGTMEGFLGKITTYAHTEHNREHVKDPRHIVSSILLHLDIADRGYLYYFDLRVQTDDEVPQRFRQDESIMDMPSWIATARPQHLSHLWDRWGWAEKLGYDPEEIVRTKHKEYEEIEAEEAARIAREEQEQQEKLAREMEAEAIASMEAIQSASTSETTDASAVPAADGTLPDTGSTSAPPPSSDHIPSNPFPKGPNDASEQLPVSPNPVAPLPAFKRQRKHGPIGTDEQGGFFVDAKQQPIQETAPTAAGKPVELAQRKGESAGKPAAPAGGVNKPAVEQAGK